MLCPQSGPYKKKEKASLKERLPGCIRCGETAAAGYMTVAWGLLVWLAGWFLLDYFNRSEHSFVRSPNSSTGRTGGARKQQQR